VSSVVLHSSPTLDPRITHTQNKQIRSQRFNKPIMHQCYRRVSLRHGYRCANVFSYDCFVSLSSFSDPFLFFPNFFLTFKSNSLRPARLDAAHAPKQPSSALWLDHLRRFRLGPAVLGTSGETPYRLRSTVQHPRQHVEDPSRREPDDEAAQVFGARGARLIHRSREADAASSRVPWMVRTAVFFSFFFFLSL